MACFICGASHTHNCTKCLREVCPEHAIRSHRTDFFVCPECDEGERTARRDIRLEELRRQNRLAESLPRRTCEYCASASEKELPRCQICFRRFCPKCGEVIVANTEDGTLMWRRCCNHAGLVSANRHS